LTRFWLAKGCREFETARQIAALPSCHLDIAILHCHRAAEKTLRAFLIHHDHSLPATYDLPGLLTVAMTYEPGFSAWMDAAQILSGCASTHNEPGGGTEPTRVEFERALDAAAEFVSFIPMLLPRDLHSG